MVLDRIEQAKARAGRSEEVRLVAVTKGHAADAVEAVIAAGIEDCGENRVPELEEKVEAIGRERISWHMVGHLQRNKVRRTVPFADLIQSVDSIRLARELSREAERIDTPIDVLIQMNTSGETRKYGFAAGPGDETGEALEQIDEVCALPGLRVLGLMTMAPLTGDASILRRTFASARWLFEECARAVSGFEARHLSMGMSNDYEIAVEEGSTMVRLGTVLLGERGQ